MDLEDLGPRLERAADRVGPATYRTVTHQAALLRGKIRARASMRPGPNVITGDYRSSWRIQSRPIPHGGHAIIGTDRPQGRRLEFGFFNMRDSLGRLFFQVPRPHVGPAVAEISDQYAQAFRDAVDDAIGGA